MLSADSLGPACLCLMMARLTARRKFPFLGHKGAVRFQRVVKSDRFLLRGDPQRMNCTKLSWDLAKNATTARLLGWACRWPQAAPLARGNNFATAMFANHGSTTGFDSNFQRHRLEGAWLSYVDFECRVSWRSRMAEGSSPMVVPSSTDHRNDRVNRRHGLPL